MARVLLVEDDDQVASVFVEGLTDEGHAVERVVAAYDAFLVVLAKPYDLVLMDLAIPGVNGVVTGAAMRGVGFSGPIVALTGNLLPVDQSVLDRAGFSGRILKPTTIQALLGEITKHLGPGS